MALQDHAHQARPARALRLYMQARECEARLGGPRWVGHCVACACVHRVGLYGVDECTRINAVSIVDEPKNSNNLSSKDFILSRPEPIPE